MISFASLLDLLLVPLSSAVLRFKDDNALVERLRRRDPDAMGELYDRYGKIAYAVIFRIVRNQSTAEDLTQETFLRVWNRSQAFDGERGALGPWILTVARNRAIDYLRSLDGRMARNSFEIEKVETPRVFGDLDMQIFDRDRMEHLRGAFDQLNANQRMVIELAYFEGLSQTEMAEKMNQPLGTVKTWVRSALKALRDAIGAQQAVAS